MSLKVYYSIVFSFLFSVSTFVQVNDGANYVSASKGKDFFALSESGKSTALFVSSADYPGVLRALNDLKTDIGKVTDTKPEVTFDNLSAQKEVVIVGTLGKSPVIDQLVENKKLDVSEIKGKWETYVIQTLVKPFPGMDKALIIAGSDKRGTIFGIYDVSSHIGISPWYWSFYFDYAWNPSNWPSDKLKEYAIHWAQQQFGEKYAEQIGRVMTRYSNYNGLRKPELMLLFNRFSLTNYREFETIVANYKKLRDDAEKINNRLPAEYKDVYFETVLHPIQAVSNSYELFYALARNKMYAGQGGASTNKMADLVKEYSIKDSLLSHYYNHELKQGKWSHMMDQTHVNYTPWRGPDVESVPKTMCLDLKKEAQMEIAIEGSGTCWPNDSTEAVLPTFNSYHDTAFYIEVFNRGTMPFNYSVQSDVTWVIVSPSSGSILEQEHLWVTIDWKKAPKGKHEAHLMISGAGNRKISVTVPVDDTETKETLAGKSFVESNRYVSINAVNYSNAISCEGYSWHHLDNYGKIGSDITLLPPTMLKQEATESAPHLEYKVFLKDTGMVNLQVYLGSTIDYSGGNSLHYALAFDEQPSQIINSTLKKPGEFWVNNNSDKVMMDDVRVDESVHKIRNTGEHTLKFWVIDKGLIVQKLVIDCGGVKPGELGPPESYNSIK